MQARRSIQPGSGFHRSVSNKKTQDSGLATIRSPWAELSITGLQESDEGQNRCRFYFLERETVSVSMPGYGIQEDENSLFHPRIYAGMFMVFSE
jgi:hypothetical protein